MDLSELLLVFAMLWKLTSGLQCYECASMLVWNTEHLCDQFDYSDLYIADCDSSSMCYKRITTSQFGTKIYERGCAKQTLSDYQELINDQWVMVKKINEVYEEGCKDVPPDALKVTRNEFCYCRGHLCNGANSLGSNAFSLGLTTTFGNIVRVIAISVLAIGVSAIGLTVLR